MVRLILGRSGSGKSRRIMDELCERTRREQGGCMMIVPEQYSHEKERDLCRMAGDAASRFVEVFSFKSLARRILWSGGGLARPMLDDGGRLLVLRLAVQTVAPRLKTYAGTAARVDFLDKLSRAIEEFIRYCVTPKDLSDAAEQMPEGVCRDKLQDLSLLYGAYDALVSTGPADPQSLLTFAAERMADSGICLDREIYVDGFAGFTPQEWRFLEALCREAGRLTLCISAPSADTPFESPAAAVADLARFCSRNHIELTREILQENRRAKTEALRRLEANFFDRTAEPFDGEAEEVRILTARSRRSECMAVAAEIRRLCTEEGYRYREIAVISGENDNYDSLLAGVFDEYGIPYFSDRTRQMTEQPIYRMISAALEAVERSFDSEAVISFLRCSLSGFSESDCDLLENYVRTWKMPGWRWISEKDWTGSPEGLCRRPDDRNEALLRRINELRHKAIEPLKMLDAVIRPGGDAARLCTALYEFTNAIGLPENLARLREEFEADGMERESGELSQQYALYCNALDQIVRAGQNSLFTLREFADAVRLVLGNARVGSIPDSLDSVAAGQLGRMRISAPRAVFLIGVNDGSIPASNGRSGLLTDDEREQILAADAGIRLAPSGLEAMEAENFILYTALAAPSERLYVSVPETDETGNGLRPSYVPERIRRLLPGASVICCDDEDSRTRSPEGLLELAAEGGSALRRRAKEVLLKEPAAKEKLRRIQRTCLPDEPVSDEKTNRALYGDRMYISASRMEKYAACRFRYFAEVGLGAKEPANAEFRAIEIGTMIHYVLENVARQVKLEGLDWIRETPERLEALTSRFAEEFVDSPEGIPKDVRTPRIDYFVQRLTSDMQEIVRRMHDEFKASKFRPEAFEADLGENGEIAIHFEDREIVLTGRVDRIDTWEKDGEKYLRVVDYKSGNKELNYTDLEAGLAIQMFLYLFVLTDRSRSIPAGVLYTKASFPRMNAEPGRSEESYESERDDKQRPTGLLLEEDEVLEAMEEGASGGKARFLPKNREYRVSLLEFQKLRRHMNKLLSVMTAELRKGIVTPNPYSKAEKDYACLHCPYRTVCRFDESRAGCRPHYLKRKSKQEFFGEERE